MVLVVCDELVLMSVVIRCYQPDCQPSATVNLLLLQLKFQIHISYDDATTTVMARRYVNLMF